MYFASLEIENIKCFEHVQTLDLKDNNGAISPWTLILGDNGVGKTTLLKSLAWMIPVEDPDTTNAKVGIKPFMDDIDDESEFDQLIRVGRNVKSRIKATFSNGTNLGEVPPAEDLVSTGMNFERINGKLELVQPDSGVLDEFNSPNLFAYGANRHMGKKNFEQSELKNPFLNLFSDFGDLYDAGQVLSNLDYASIKEKGGGKATDLLKKVKQILVDLLPDITSTDSIIINSPVGRDGTLTDKLVEVNTPYGEVPLYDLSLGYRTMLAWSVDLALRMLWRNPDEDQPLEQPAIVLIDEIDLHLHPTWQRNVREYLVRHFPKTQFICTAHSPFMAQSSETENLCVLDRSGNEVLIHNDPFVVKGWRIGQIATSDLFRVASERSVETEKQIYRRRELLDKTSRSSEEDAELQRLDADLSSLPVAGEKDEQKLLDELQQVTKFIREGGRL